MRISEAIRRGAAMRPQCRFIMFDSVGSCAIGAAIEGAGIEQYVIPDKLCQYVHVTLGELCTAYPEWTPILNALVPSPDSQVPDASQTAWTVVMYLNDERKWAREDIADWLKGVEDKFIAEGKYIPCTT